MAKDFEIMISKSWNRGAIRFARPVPQFHKKSEELSCIKQRPTGAGADSGSRLQHRYSRFRQFLNHRIDIAHLKEHVMDSAAVLIEKVLVPTAAVHGLNQFDLNIAQLDKCLLDANALLDAVIVVLGLRPIRPFDEAKRSHAQQGSQKLRGSISIGYHNSDLHEPLKVYSTRKRGWQARCHF